MLTSACNHCKKWCLSSALHAAVSVLPGQNLTLPWVSAEPAQGNKASLPETPTKSSQRIQNTIFIVFNFMLHSLCFRFEHIHHNTGLPQFPRAICGDYPPEPKILSRLESRGSVVLAGGFCVSFGCLLMFIVKVCTMLHIFSVLSALPVTSIVWNTDLKTRVISTCQQKLSPKLIPKPWKLIPKTHKLKSHAAMSPSCIHRPG